MSPSNQNTVNRAKIGAVVHEYNRGWSVGLCQVSPFNRPASGSGLPSKLEVNELRITVVKCQEQKQPQRIQYRTEDEQICD
jgi:hypothetical protein